jgi:hypothetical protein
LSSEDDVVSGCRCFHRSRRSCFCPPRSARHPKMAALAVPSRFAPTRRCSRHWNRRVLSNGPPKKLVGELARSSIGFPIASARRCPPWKPRSCFAAQHFSTPESVVCRRLAPQDLMGSPVRTVADGSGARGKPRTPSHRSPPLSAPPKGRVLCRREAACVTTSIPAPKGSPLSRSALGSQLPGFRRIPASRQPGIALCVETRDRIGSASVGRVMVNFFPLLSPLPKQLRLLRSAVDPRPSSTGPVRAPAGRHHLRQA